MNAGKQRLTFISYSRVDADFALELAKELRSSGFMIWLDQLDIPPGARWDDEIERALEQCEIFMVILTPSSITSDNVKDEIGYAIDSDKRILPVLLENAKVPFRLRRFQYVNFTDKSHAEGIQAAEQLLEKLITEPTEPNRVIPPDAPPQADRASELKADAHRLARQRAEAVQRARQQELLQKSPQTVFEAPTYERKSPTPQTNAGSFPRLLSLAIGVPVLLLLCFGGGWIARPFLFPTATATEPPRSTEIQPSISVPSDTPTSAIEVTNTVTFTAAPVDTSTVTPFAPKEPDQFLNFFFETIIYQRDYELAWSLLSDSFKANNSAAGFEDWKNNTWANVHEWRRPTWTVTYDTTSKAYVSTPEMWFRGSSWYSLTDREYCVIRDESRNTWIIESRVVCEQ